MHYVKHFHINGVDTKQVACIELQGAPNAATEGAVGVLGMDMTSPTHEVYRCVAVNGSVYTWELLSAGMSIISATITGEGSETKSFPYANLLRPNNYRFKVGDLILDSEGYLYQISALGSTSCDASYCGTQIGGIASGDKNCKLILKDGQLQLITESGNILSTIDYLISDEDTIYRNPDTGEVNVIGIRTINDTVLKFFVGTQEEYNALTTEQKENLFALITNDTSGASIQNAINSLEKALDGCVKTTGYNVLNGTYKLRSDEPEEEVARELKIYALKDGTLLIKSQEKDEQSIDGYYLEFNPVAEDVKDRFCIKKYENETVVARYPIYGGHCYPVAKVEQLGFIKLSEYLTLDENYAAVVNLAEKAKSLTPTMGSVTMNYTDEKAETTVSLEKGKTYAIELVHNGTGDTYIFWLSVPSTTGTSYSSLCAMPNGWGKLIYYGTNTLKLQQYLSNSGAWIGGYHDIDGTKSFTVNYRLIY